MKGQAAGTHGGGAQVHNTRTLSVRTINKGWSQFSSPAAFPDPLSMQSYIFGPN